MSTRRKSLIHSCPMFQTPTEYSPGPSFYQSSSKVKPPIFTSCHSITSRRSSKDLLNTGASLKGSRRSSVCVPSQSLQKISEKSERRCSNEGIRKNKRLSISSQGTLEMVEKKQNAPERKLSVANISEQFTSFLSMSSKMGVQVINLLLIWI